MNIIETTIIALLVSFGMSNNHESSELYCMAEAVYFEARNQSYEGQLAVASVIQNRKEDPRYPETICGVVREDRGSKQYDCQFSYYCDGKPEHIKETEAFAVAVYASAEVILYMQPDITNGATHYFAHDIVIPKWAKKLEMVAKIDDHTFMKE